MTIEGCLSGQKRLLRNGGVERRKSEIEAGKNITDSTSPTDSSEKRPNPNFLEPLTQREMEVYKLKAKGRTNPQIAGLLYLSEGTVKSYVNKIYQKLNIEHRGSKLGKQGGIYFHNHASGSEVLLPNEKAKVIEISYREFQTLWFSAQGFTRKQCGEVIGVEDSSIKRYVKNLYYKLDCENSYEAVLKLRSGEYKFVISKGDTRFRSDNAVEDFGPKFKQILEKFIKETESQKKLSNKEKLANLKNS